MPAAETRGWGMAQVVRERDDPFVDLLRAKAEPGTSADGTRLGRGPTPLDASCPFSRVSRPGVALCGIFLGIKLCLISPEEEA